MDSPCSKWEPRLQLNLSQASKGEREEYQAVRDEPASDILEKNGIKYELIKFF